MFVCPSCGEGENTVCGGSELEQFFECGKCGYRAESPFGIVYDDGFLSSWKLTPMEAKL